MKGTNKQLVSFDNHPYWSETTKISWLQRAVVIHSLLYYRYNESIIQDSDYDLLCVQLLEMQSKLSEKEVREKTTYGYAFYDFDGSTGFDVVSRLTALDFRIVEIIANVCLRKYKEERA